MLGIEFGAMGFDQRFDFILLRFAQIELMQKARQVRFIMLGSMMFGWRHASERRFAVHLRVSQGYFR